MASALEPQVSRPSLPAPGAPRTRRGLVLGAGGVLGAAWTIGALAVIEEQLGWDPRSADVIVGTSAGSVLAAFLGCGIGTQTLLNHQRGELTQDDPHIQYDYDTDTGGAMPPRPRIGTVGSRPLLRHTWRHPLRVTPLTALAAVLPAGRGDIAPIGRIVEQALPADKSWAPHPNTWIVAMDYESGRRVPFGRIGAPAARLPEAVMASCAIPAWYRPIEIGGRRYVDGGMCSPFHLDLLARADVDEVVVLAPMAAFAFDRPTSVVVRLERQLRRSSTKRLLREEQKVKATGKAVTILAPGPEDLHVIGANMMDPTRRLDVLDTSLRTSAAALAVGGSAALAS